MTTKNMRAFLRKGPFLLIMTLFVALTASPARADSGQDGVLFRFGGAERLVISERSDLRLKENGGYGGFLSRESRILYPRRSVEENDSGNELFRYRGVSYIMEQTMFHASAVSRRVQESLPSEIVMYSDGRMEVPGGGGFPRLRSFPVFPDEPVAPGDSWRAFGVRVVDPERKDVATKVRFYCQYDYRGLEQTDLGLRHVIQAQYAMRYRRGDDPEGDPNLLSVNGRHLVTIYIPENGGGSLFMRDKVDEIYRFQDGGSREHSGFILTWHNQVAALPRQKLSNSLTDVLEQQGVDDVAIRQAETGLALTVNNIHFVPDKADILPAERKRLAVLAELLLQIPDRSFLVVGHTADVGSVESQYRLSEERAETVIAELVKRGVAARRFLFRGAGGDEPVADNRTEEGRAANRRVEIIILED